MRALKTPENPVWRNQKNTVKSGTESESEYSDVQRDQRRLLRRLPYRDPDRLVIACGDMRKRNVKDFPLSNVDFLDLQNRARSTFEDFAAVQTFGGTIPRTDGTIESIGAIVSQNFFRLMGQPIVAGRDFTAADGTPQAAPLAAPLENSASRCRWNRSFMLFTNQFVGSLAMALLGLSMALALAMAPVGLLRSASNGWTPVLRVTDLRFRTPLMAPLAIPAIWNLLSRILYSPKSRSTN